ncbi:hypothetical protein [uncultured Polaribacter sp.]|uniref:hypothetical protein n=1 Tax=uncultured Polaribacter sp. TaxID=174711 RepID=UPI002620D581|nr:hypothetical protein [uncultured Polaribacter sp.]
MKKIYKIFIFLIIIVGCDNKESINEISSDEINQLEIVNLNINKETEINFIDNNVRINFKAFKGENIITSNLTLKNKNEEVKILSNSFKIDKNIKSFKLGISEDIENSAKQIQNQLKLEVWLNVRDSYENFIKNLTKEVTIREYQSDLIQSTFYQLSIFNTIIRSIEEKKNCECTPLPAYFVGKSSFWCQEDYFFETNDLLEYYAKNKNQLFSFEGGKKEFDYLTNLNKNKVSSKELFSLHNSVQNFKLKVKEKYSNDNNLSNNLPKSEDENENENENEDGEDCWSGMLGSDLGCCGNYSGCCWYSSLNCLRHDVACLKCDKWHCGPACAPSILE